MSMHRVYGKCQFECDDCEDTLDTGTASFAEAVVKMREEGWKAIQIDNVWEHRCPGCQKEMVK